MICKICGNSEGNKLHKVKEMMFGTREEFDYFECSKCLCLQIEEIPEDLSQFYPDNYYSYAKRSSPRGFLGITKRILRRKRNFAEFTGKGLIGNLLSKIYPNSILRVLRNAVVDIRSKILDVGCGDGALICDLHEMGYKNVSGIDPFISQNIEYKSGVRILKKHLHEIHDQFDIVMFHHSFEHLSNPIETFQKLPKLLKENGTCIIRMPTVSSYAWKYYGLNWVAIDPPRHIFIHSLESINILCSMANLQLKEIIYDSTILQFWASEQYLQDISLISEKSYGKNPRNSIFSKSEIKEFQRKTNELNATQLGDSAAYIIKK